MANARKEENTIPTKKAAKSPAKKYTEDDMTKTILRFYTELVGELHEEILRKMSVANRIIKLKGGKAPEKLVANIEGMLMALRTVYKDYAEISILLDDDECYAGFEVRDGDKASSILIDDVQESEEEKKE